MAKSNLRQKDKTFNFGLAADFSDSEEEDCGGSSPKPVDFYEASQQQTDLPRNQTPSDDEIEIQVSSKPRVNPFASRKGNQEIQASKLSQMRRKKINQQKQSKMQKVNIGLKLDDDDQAEKGGEVEGASKDLAVKPSLSTI